MAMRSIASPRRGDDGAAPLRLEPASDDEASAVPPAWSVDFARDAGAQREDAPLAAAASVDGGVPSVRDVGLRVVRGAMDGLSKRSRRKGPTKNRGATPTPVQLRLWPALLHSFELRGGPGRSRAPNVVGIAPTGTGESNDEDFIDARYTHLMVQ